MVSTVIAVMFLTVFIVCLWFGAWPFASVSLICFGVSWRYAVERWSKYQAQRVARRVFYYDVMSAYPKAMMVPLTKEEQKILKGDES